MPYNEAVCLQAAGPLRPTYCNVPGWAQAVLYLASIVAIGLFAYGIARHVLTWHAGQGPTPSRNRGHVRARFKAFAAYALGQKATWRKPFPGLFHSGLFYGFVLLFIGTVLATVDYDVGVVAFGALGLEGGRFLEGTFYLIYEAILDAAGAVFLLGLLLGGIRRYVVKPHRVIGAWDVIIWSLVLINATGFLVEGLRLTFAPVPHGSWSWLGYGLSRWFMYLGIPPDAAVSAHLWLWLVHMVLSLGFIAAIPFSNAVHMIATPANLVMRPFEPRPIGAGAALQPIDIEAAESFGAGRLVDFGWKQRLGFDACTRCGRCEVLCPAYMAGTALNPKQIIVSLSNALRGELERPIAIDAEGAVVVGNGLLVTPGALFACTTCMACVEECPALIEIVDDIVDMRRYLTLTEGALPGTSGGTLRNMGTSGNPWGYPQEQRTAWTDGLDVTFAAPGEHYEVLYWVGCSGSYDQRNQKISRAMVRLLNAAGVRWALMRDERCTCESARRLGEEYLYQTATGANIATVGQYTFDRVVCHCPHCFNTLANEWPQFGGELTVIHHTQLLRELLDGGRLKVAPSALERVTFHDSCYLGRYNREFDAPRDALRAAGVTVVDPPRARENGLCCGGGGGKMWFESPAVNDVQIIRLEELMGTKPDVVGVACPFCLTMLDSARSTLAADVKIMDVAEVLAAALDGMPSG